MTKGKWLALGGLIVALSSAAGGVYYWRMAKARAAMQVVDELPEFTEPGPGPRAPRSNFFGFDIGKTTLEEAQARTTELGIECRDTSMRALMHHTRETKTKAALARGDEVDDVSSASWNRPSRRERNPQVRLSCRAAPLHQLDPRYPEGLEGRLLLVFDSADLPLRHVSVRRSAREEDAQGAMIDGLASLANMRRILGTTYEGEGAFATDTIDEATLQAAELEFATLGGAAPPDAGPAPATLDYNDVPMVNVAHWEFADLEVEVEVHHVQHRVSINEGMGVPWPVRSDAPTLPPNGPSAAR